jgi:hypothetical protein
VGKYSTLQEGRVRIKVRIPVFLRFGIPDLGSSCSFDGEIRCRGKSRIGCWRF